MLALQWWCIWVLQAHKEVALAGIRPVVGRILPVATVQLRGCSCRATLHQTANTTAHLFALNTTMQGPANPTSDCGCVLITFCWQRAVLLTADTDAHEVIVQKEGTCYAPV